MYLHGRAGKLASLLLYKAEMTSVRPSVGRHVDSSVVSAWIDVGLRFVYSCGLWHVNTRFNKFLRALCWAHERLKDFTVVLLPSFSVA